MSLSRSGCRRSRFQRRRAYHGPAKIVSGGQTGVDRAALDAAIAAGLPVGGWCPRGRWSEDGRIADRYPLRETPLCRVCQRTLWNIRDADATLVLARGRPRGGTALTRLGPTGTRPRLLVDPSDRRALGLVRRWLNRYDGCVLNIGGPRASEDPEIYDLAHALLMALFQSGPKSR